MSKIENQSLPQPIALKESAAAQKTTAFPEKKVEKTDMPTPVRYTAPILTEDRPANMLRERSCSISSVNSDSDSDSEIEVLTPKQVENMQRIKGHIKQKAGLQKEQTNLTRGEKTTVEKYTSCPLFSHAYREHLEEKNIKEIYSMTPEQAKKTCLALSKAIDKLPDYKGVVFHGFIPKKQSINKIHVGDFITNTAFLSTSVSKEFASLYANYDEDENEMPETEKSAILVITSDTGKNIAGLAKEDYDAAEILFQPDTVFLVEKKIENHEKNMALLYVKEAPPNLDLRNTKDLFTGKYHTPVFKKSLYE